MKQLFGHYILGQQVVEEIMDSQRPGCPREFENIDVPKGHDLFDTEGKGNVQLPFIRSRYDFRTGQSPNNPRQQVYLISIIMDIFSYAHLKEIFSDG